MNKDTYDKIQSLRLPGMARAYKEQTESEGIEELTFDQRLELLVDAEVDSQHNHKIERLINNARFTESKASITQIKYYSDRHLSKEQINNLSTNEYIKKHENILIIGATGCGKSYIACALGVEACNAGLKVKYVRLPDLLSELELSRLQGNYRNKIRQYEKCDLLILDEWLLVSTNNIEQQDILEVLEKRYRIHSTILCSQFEVAGWHSKLGGGALAEAILDRIVPKSHTIKISGEKSMRSR
jgi:DNA replication protein DnaC